VAVRLSGAPWLLIEMRVLVAVYGDDSGVFLGSTQNRPLRGDQVNKQRTRVWVGIDVGKAHHWAAVVDHTGATVWSRKITNDESAILAALGEILGLAEQVSWAVDIAGTASARAAYLAGFTATSNLEAGRRYGIPTAGTSAHAFTLLHDSPVATSVTSRTS
jgi:Transposase